MTIGKRFGLIFAIIFVLLVFVAGAVGFATAEKAFASEQSITYIDEESELKDLAESVNSGNTRLGEKFVLTKNLEFKSDNEFVMIGGEYAFHGELDGAGNTIWLDLDRAEGNSSSALIGKLGTSGVVKNLTVSGSISGNALVAGIAAENAGKITSCVVDATITNEGTSTSTSITGGIAAKSVGQIDSCVSLGNISAPFNVGGVVGTSGGTLKNSVYLGSITVTGTAPAKVGGIVGTVSESMSACYSRSSITLGSSGNADMSTIGSVLGSASASATLTNNYAVADEFSFPAGGQKDVASCYERKSLYDFLSEDGVELSDAYARADYAVGCGYLYAPLFLLADNKTIFADKNIESKFAASLFASGDGTKDNPWIIGEKKQWSVGGADCWKLFRTNASLFNYSDKYVKCGTDLNVGADYSLGTEATPFSGIFDGNDVTVTINETISFNDNSALFAFVGGGAEIKNFKLSGEITGDKAVAAAVANASGKAKITKITNNCRVTGKSFVGGVVGRILSGEVTAENCVNNAEICSIGASENGKVGGVIGYAQQGATMKSLANYGKIIVHYGGTTDVGGVVGAVYDTKEISALHNEGTINAGKTDNVGGVIGSISVSDARTITSLGAVCSVIGKNYVGGIIGKINANGGVLTVQTFASLTELGGQNYVAGTANVVGKVKLSTGYFTGSITQSKSESVAEFSCDPIANVTDGANLETKKVYYNGDDGNKATKTTAEAKNAIELTCGTTFSETAMKEETPSITNGTYPFPEDDKEMLKSASKLGVAYFDGTETSEEPTIYLIGTEQALRNLSFFTKTETSDEYKTYSYKLTSDITMTRKFDPITNFKGIFDGNEKTIIGLTITADGDSVGMFDVLKENATVKNLFLSGGEITSSKADAIVGAICGKAEKGTTIEGVAADITVRGKGKIIGGLIGSDSNSDSNNVVKQSFFAGKIICESDGATAGGILGESDGATITDCFFVGKISNKGVSGGIVGNARNTTIEQCYASGRIEGETSGGIIGKANGGEIRRAYVIADVVYTDPTSEEKGAIYGVFDGTAPTLEDCFYNKDYIGLGAYHGVTDNVQYAKSEEYFTVFSSGYFAQEGYMTEGGGLNDACDAYYAHYLTAYKGILSGSGDSVYAEKVAYYVKKSVEIAIFGTNTASDYTSGTENNPYVVDTAQRFAKISDLVKQTDFAGKYFVVTRDIDMNDVTSMKAIGYYSLESQKPFSGVMYGEIADGKRPVISNVKITEATDGTTTAKNYLGVFACTGDGFVLRDLVFTGTVNGENEVAGIVGYMYRGTIEYVWSQIDVTASGNNAEASGIVSEVSGETVLIGSICSGKITADNVFGLVGAATASGLTINAQASWYVVKGTVTYDHNNIGSVLFDYSDETKGEALEIEDGADKGFGFNAKYGETSKYKGKILNVSDEIVDALDGSAFFDKINENVTRIYAVRYCAPITATVKYADETNDETYATAKTLGEYYYIGQTVTVSITFTDEGKKKGVKFVGLKDKNNDEYKYSVAVSDGDVGVELTMSENTEEITLVIGKIAETILQFGRDDGKEYNGQAVDVTFADGIDGAIAMYVSGKACDEIRNAGQYDITASIYGDGKVIGIYETSFTVKQKVLTLSDDVNEYKDFLTTTYEKGKKTRGYTFATNDNGVVGGTIDGDNPMVTLTFEFGQENARENISVKIISASTAESNYTFGEETKDFRNTGTINKKTITVKVPGADEEGIIAVEYSASEPAFIVGEYEIAIKWTFETEDGSAVTKYNVGSYKATPEAKSTADKANYSVVSEIEYTLKIEPYEVREGIFYGKTETGYTGEDIGGEITDAAYFTVPHDESHHAMRLTFYTDEKGEKVAECVINAGTYFVKGTPVDANYAINAALQKITITKKDAGALNITFKKDGEEIKSGDTVTVEDRISIEVEGDYAKEEFDGKFVIDENGFNTAKEADKWYIIPTIGGDNRKFTVKTKYATNYQDGASSEFVLKVEKKNIYAILGKNEFTFGDKIGEDMLNGIEYYYIAEDGTVGEEVPSELIGKATNPTVGFGTTVLNANTYKVTFTGGGSDGYSFEYYTAKTPNADGKYEVSTEKTITVNKKKITVLANETAEKTYGDGKDKEKIPYQIIVEIDEESGGDYEILDSLPDGNAVVLNGAIGRDDGENVGEYALNRGTLNEDNNPNYEISYSFASKFIISKRHIKIEVAPDQGKEYGEKDKDITFIVSDEEGNDLVDSEELDIHDTVDVFKDAIKCVRKEGEDVGYYSYTIVTYPDKLRALNYETDVVEPTEVYYAITQSTPQVFFEVNGAPKYGDRVDELSYTIQVTDKYGNPVKGTTSVYVFDKTATGMRRNYILLDDDRLYAEFVPEANNYKTVTKSALITVGKRKTGVKVYYKNGADLVFVDGIELSYKGTAYSASDFVGQITEAIDLIDSEVYTVALTVSGDSKNVTSEGFSVTASLTSDYYELTGKSEFRATINKALITVSVKDATVEAGETYLPEITYDGFVGSDKASAISKEPTVRDIPDKPGYYSIKADGGVATNYDFIYNAGILTINATEAVSSGGKIGGTLSPTYTITFTELDSSGAAFEGISANADKALGSKFYKPLSVTMKEYVAIKGSNALGDGTYQYTVKFGGVTENSKIYIKLASGEIQEAEFTVAEDGEDKYAVFTSSEIVAAMRYENKTVLETVKGYAVIAIIGAVVVLLIVIAVIVSVSNKKRRNKRHTYAVRSRWK